MGTRALITLNNKPFIATHFDGYPSSLGADLLSAKTEEEIISVARLHSIDFATKKIQKICNKERFEKIAARTNGKYSAQDLANLHKKGFRLNFTIQTSSDYPIGNIENYGDCAEYQYDFNNGKWLFRSLSGAYPESINSASPLKPLTKKACKD